MILTAQRTPNNTTDLSLAFFCVWIFADISRQHEYTREDSQLSDGSIQFNSGLIRNRSFLTATRFGNVFIDSSEMMRKYHIYPIAINLN